MHHTRSTAIYPIEIKLLPWWAGAKHIIAIERTGSRWQGKKSRRRESSRGPLVKVNCAALPEHLLEAELFGHEKGAFTGANNLRIGRFEQANGGTIFLDEVGELSPTIQGKLLRVLQDKSLERLGSNQTRTDVRVLAATHRNLEKMVQLNQFREDLYYRFNVVRIELPPLRDRLEGLNQLTQHFLSCIALRNGIKSLAITESALEKLRSHVWAGNVRELQNTLERAAVFSGGRTILPKKFWSKAPSF